MHILFVTYNHLNSNSGIHIFNLANSLIRQGVHVTVCVPNGKEKSSDVGTPAFETIDFSDVYYQRWLEKVKDKGRVDIIHAWTPREGVRRTVLKLLNELNCPYVVHMEDNEDAILTANTKLPIQDLEQMNESQLNEIVGHGMSYPRQYREFIRQASGVTVIIDKLLEFAPQEMPTLIFWPGYEEHFQWSQTTDEDLKHQLGITQDDFVLTYTGNVHYANVREVYSLYLAVALLNHRGFSVKLIRTGGDFAPLIDDALSTMKKYYINLGFIPRHLMPKVVSLADVLVQPGEADQFNEYRFPSKLPEYLASGRPVLLPYTNIGRFLIDRQNCIHLKNGNAQDIVQTLEGVFPNHDMRKTIGQNGRKFAQKHLRWEISSKKLRDFYKAIIKSQKTGK